MPQAFCAPQSVPEPYSVAAGGSLHTVVTVEELVSVPWTAGGTDTYLPTTKAASAYGGVEVDTTQFVWMLLAVRGTAHPVLIKEADFTAWDTILSNAQWAKLGRLVGAGLYPVPQV